MAVLPWGEIRSLLAQEPSTNVFHDILDLVGEVHFLESYQKEMLPYLSSALHETWPSYDILPRDVPLIEGVTPLGNTLKLTDRSIYMPLRGQVDHIQHFCIETDFQVLPPYVTDALAEDFPQLESLELSRVFVRMGSGLGAGLQARRVPLKRLSLSNLSGSPLSLSIPCTEHLTHLTLGGGLCLTESSPVPPVKVLDISSHRLMPSALEAAGREPCWSSVETLVMAANTFEHYVVKLPPKVTDLTLVGGFVGSRPNLLKILPQLKSLTLSGDIEEFLRFQLPQSNYPLLESLTFNVSDASGNFRRAYDDWRARLNAPNLKEIKINHTTTPMWQPRHINVITTL